MAKPKDLRKIPPIQDIETRPVDFAEPLGDYNLPIANEQEARALNLNPDTARCVGQAVSDLLAGLPRDQTDDAGNGIYAFVGVEPCEPQTLSVPVSKMLAPPGELPIKWRQVKQLPGYQARPIRKMGNDIFMAFPCFREFAEEAREKGFDGHGEVLTISDFTHDKTTVEHVARMIADKGVLLDVAQLDYGTTATGYRPRIALLMTETWTFKLVQDRVENGAPANANFIYAWQGGASFYRPKLSPQPNPRGKLTGMQPQGSANLLRLAPGET